MIRQFISSVKPKGSVLVFLWSYFILIVRWDSVCNVLSCVFQKWLVFELILVLICQTSKILLFSKFWWFETWLKYFRWKTKPLYTILRKYISDPSSHTDVAYLRAYLRAHLRANALKGNWLRTFLVFFTQTDISQSTDFLIHFLSLYGTYKGFYKLL